MKPMRENTRSKTGRTTALSADTRTSSTRSTRTRKAAHSLKRQKSTVKTQKDLLEEYRSDLDNKTVDQFRAFTENVTDEDVRAHDTFHWVLEFAEVFADDGFDVVVGNPPWDEIKSDRKEFFVKYDPVFRSLPTHGMDERQEELLEDEDIKTSGRRTSHG